MITYIRYVLTNTCNDCIIYAMSTNNEFEYNNEEEAEMAQLHSIHNNMNHIASVRRLLAAQASLISLANCEDCEEKIPKARLKVRPGCRRCVHCETIYERKIQGY